MDAGKRLRDIDSQLAALEAERAELEKQILAEKENKWTHAALEARLRKAVLSHYGSAHSIKLVKLIMNGVYDDSYHCYENPVIMIVDNNFNDVAHNINAHDFCPTDREQSEIYQMGGEIPESVTIRF